MGQVSVTLNNRTYRLACNDGEEARLSELARDVKSRVETLAREFGQPADERILLMAAVLLADELMDLREAHEAMLAAAAEVLREAAATPAASSKADNSRQEPSKQDQAKSSTAKVDAAKPDASRPDAKGEQRAGPGGAQATGLATAAPGGSAQQAIAQGQSNRAKTSAA